MKTLYISNADLTRDKRFSYLSADATSGASTITVQSIKEFAVNQILCIGELGNQQTEIIKTHAVTAPSGSTVTLAANLTFSHPQDTRVYVIDYDQYEVSWSSTVSGSKTVLATNNIQADTLQTLYNDTVESSGYYFVRFKETIGGTFSDYSDPIPYGGYPDNSVYSIKKRALDVLNEKIDGKIITNEFMNDSLWEARRLYHQSPGKRPFRRVFNASIGTVSAGIYRVVLPDNCEKPWTADNVYGVRIGVNPNLYYYDKKEFDRDYQGVAHATLTTAYAIGDQDLYCDDVRQFSSTGGSVALENDTIAYSAVGISGGTLRISTAGAYSHAIGTDVWQGIYSGLPTHFTVWGDSTTVSNLSTGSGYIYFNTILSTVYANNDIFCDYYRTLRDYDSDADILDEPEYDMFVDYVAYKVQERKGSGSVPVYASRSASAGAMITDPHYMLWERKKAEALAKEYIGAEIRSVPDVSHLSIPE